MVLPSGQKLTLSPLFTISLELVPFRAYAPFPALVPFFESLLIKENETKNSHKTEALYMKTKYHPEDKNKVSFKSLK
jgi:hypothetical protein